MRLLALALAALAVPLTSIVSQTRTPCTKGVPACARWVTVPHFTGRSKAYSTYPLEVPNSAITGALIMVHGGERDADQYFETATAAAFLAAALDKVIVIAPRYAADDDVRAGNEVAWFAGGQNAWRAGGFAVADSTLTTFDVMDDLIRRVADKRVFSHLTTIVVAGHSAGGQFVTRYAMSNRVHGIRGVKVTYVVANPSSFAWPVAMRPASTGDADPLVAEKAALGPEGGRVHTNYSFAPFDASKAPDFNEWPAGLEDRVGYSARLDDSTLKRQLVERPTTYLFGQLDVFPLGGFDASPRGMAQGPTRRARGEAFFKYVTEVMGAKHQAVIVPHCGHSARCVFTSPPALEVLFPKP